MYFKTVFAMLHDFVSAAYLFSSKTKLVYMHQKNLI